MGGTSYNPSQPGNDIRRLINQFDTEKFLTGIAKLIGIYRPPHPTNLFSKDTPKDLTNKIGKIAEKFGIPVKADAIHKAKESLGGGIGKGGRRNPDVEVNLNDGEMYPRYPDGHLGDSIGNILDNLH